MNVYWLSRSGGSAAEGPFTFAQLKRMFDGGELGVHAQICLQGTESWTPLIQELDAHFRANAPKEGKVIKVQKSGCAPIALFFFGLALLLFLWPVGLVLIAVAIVFDCVNHHYACGNCKNELAKTSTLCPACGSKLK